VGVGVGAGVLTGGDDFLGAAEGEADASETTCGVDVGCGVNVGAEVAGEMEPVGVGDACGTTLAPPTADTCDACGEEIPDSPPLQPIKLHERITKLNTGRKVVAFSPGRKKSESSPCIGWLMLFQ
jgi:hypothetical protein